VALLIGIVLALAVGVFGRVVGLDRDRAFYPTVTVVVASYYCLFAVMGASSHALLFEAMVAAAFVAAAAFGFRSSLWIAAMALAAHGIFDVVHDRFISNPGVPPWWPDFCMAFDLVAAGYLAWLIRSRRVQVHP
jgi:hypothetical protein